MNMTLFTRRLSWALLLTIPFWVGACKKDTDATPSTAAVQGSWRVSGYTIDPAFDLLGNGTKTNDLFLVLNDLFGQQFVDCLKVTTVTFAADGKVTGSTTAACSSLDTSPFSSTATWTLTGNKLKITEGTDVTEYDASVSGNTLKLSETLTDDFDGDNKKETATLSLAFTKV